MPMRIDVLYFAGAREAAGRPSERVEVPDGTTVATLRGELSRRHPSLAAAWPTTRVAIGERFAAESAALAEGDVVALIPPVSGG
jgi:molybdopterin converting factor subunit 1